MTNPHDKQSLKQEILDLQDKLHDCVAYVSSDFCVSCTEMQEKIIAYETRIKELKDLLESC